MPQHLARLQHSLDGIGSRIRTRTRNGRRSSASSSAGSRSPTRASTSRSRAASPSATTRFRRACRPTVFMMSNPLATPSRGAGRQRRRGRHRRGQPLAPLRPQDDLARRQRADAPVRGRHGAIETVMFRDGHLTEASASNVLVVIDGTIVAPPKDNLILPGITYDAAYEFAREAALPSRSGRSRRPRRSPRTRCGSRRRRRKCSR